MYHMFNLYKNTVLTSQFRYSLQINHLILLSYLGNYSFTCAGKPNNSTYDNCTRSNSNGVYRLKKCQ